MRRRGEEQFQQPSKTVVIPIDPITEQVIVAAGLVAENDIRDKLLDRIDPDCFYVDEYRAAWAALREMKLRKLEYDPATMHRIAGDRVRASHMTELATLRPDVPANLEQYIDWLLWDRKRTTVANGPLAGLLEALKNPRESPDRVRSLARSIGQSFEGYNQRRIHIRP